MYSNQGVHNARLGRRPTGELVQRRRGRRVGSEEWEGLGRGGFDGDLDDDGGDDCGDG